MSNSAVDVENGFGKESPMSETSTKAPALRATLSKAFLSTGMPVTFKVSSAVLLDQKAFLCTVF
jgi:hypothetical protein